jgi:hypothetical protein
MNREQARRRLEQTSNFTLVGGRVLITDRRTLAMVAELRAAEKRRYVERPAQTRLAPTTTQTNA